jgi:DNA polymerase III epsilon subunit-like protein
MKITFFDTETTGLDLEKDRVIQLALRKYED